MAYFFTDALLCVTSITTHQYSTVYNPPLYDLLKPDGGTDGGSSIIFGKH